MKKRERKRKHPFVSPDHKVVPSAAHLQLLCVSPTDIRKSTVHSLQSEATTDRQAACMGNLREADDFYLIWRAYITFKWIKARIKARWNQFSSEVDNSLEGGKKRERKLQSGIHGRKLASSGDHVQPQQPKTTWIVTRILISLFLFSTRLPKRDALYQKNNTNNRKKNRWMSSTVLLYNKKRSSDAVCFLVTFFGL